jgi:hypothetical protein
VERAGDAFVIWLDPPGAAGRDALCGLVEHVPSTARARFGTAAELLAFVREARRPPPPAPPAGMAPE